MNNFKLITAAVCLLIASVVAFFSFEFESIPGGRLGIKETWNDGVQTNVLHPKNYILFPGFSQRIYTYDATLQRFELKDYTIRSADNQEMTIKSYVQWRRDPSRLVQHHLAFKENAEKVAIEPAMVSAVLRHGTQFKAIDAYSGEGLISMQKDIQKDLMDNTDLKRDGILIDAFVIVYNHLNPEYLEEINKRQLATLKQSRSLEEEKAATAEALVAKARAQADLNKAVVEAQRDKEVKVLAAQADNEKAILAAKAEKEKSILEAEGKKLASIAEAEGILALGKSKAESQRLQLLAYAVEGADAYVKVEVSKSLANAFQNVKGFLPADLKFTVLSSDFNKAVDAVAGTPLVIPAR